MEQNERRDIIKVWRPHDLPQLELRQGFSVVRSVPRHWHEEYQLCLIQSGSGELKYRGHNLQTPPSSLFIVHPGEVHSNRAHDHAGCSYRDLFVDSELMHRAATEACGKSAGLPFFSTAVIFDEDVIRKYLELHFALERPSSILEKQALLLSLLTTLVTRFAESRTPPRACGAERQSIRCVRDYLVEHYAENISLEDLAGIARLSPFHFNRVFSEQVGMPPHEFQTQLRVSGAKALLRQGWPITQVASQAGFFDQSHFNRHFKRLLGVTPGQYQSNSKNVQDASLTRR